MIKKLDMMKDTRNVIDRGGIVHTVANFTAIEKINALVDAVNHIKEEYDIRFAEIEERLSEHDQEIDDCARDISKMEKIETRAENVQENTESRPVNVQDPTNWIGKLCRFWDVCKENAYIGILSEITISGHYFPKNAVFSYGNCEPVSPDDDIIYKKD